MKENTTATVTLCNIEYSPGTGEWLDESSTDIQVTIRPEIGDGAKLQPDNKKHPESLMEKNLCQTRKVYRSGWQMVNHSVLGTLLARMHVTGSSKNKSGNFRVVFLIERI